MKVEELLSRVESACGQNKSVEFSESWRMMLSTINDTIQSLVFTAQPSQLLRACVFQKEDSSHDFYTWRSYSTEEESRLNNLINRLSSENLKKLPQYDGYQLAYRIASIAEPSTLKRLQDRDAWISSNNVNITYDFDYFMSLFGESNIISEVIFGRKTTVKLEGNFSSIYIRAIVKDPHNETMSDVTFQPFTARQNIDQGGFSYSLDLIDKELKAYYPPGSPYDSYGLKIYSVKNNRTAQNALIIGNRMVFDGSVDNLKSITISAFVLPPVLLLNAQEVPAVITFSKNLFNYIIFESARLAKSLLGSVDEELEKVSNRYLHAYRNENIFSKHGHTRNTISMY